MTSSMRLRNSGLNARLSSSCTVLLIDWNCAALPSACLNPRCFPPLTICRPPRFEVMMITVFLKSTRRLELSVRTPSSSTWSRTLNTSGCAFSISSSSTTE